MSSNQPPERIVITGSSGFYGRATIRAARSVWPNASILGLDVVESSVDCPDEFQVCDVSSDSVIQQISNFRPDTIIHLAFVVNPIHNDSRMKTVNIDGTKNILQATSDCGAARLLMSSSATAYGGWPDNPLPITEEQPVRPRPEYQYAANKAEVEKLLEDFTKQHPETAVSWTRPCMIYGPGMSNYLTEFILKGPVIVLPSGNNTELQFVHLDDVARATVAILSADGVGPFNVAPQDWYTLQDLADMSGRRSWSLPMFGCLAFTKVWWALRLPWFHFPAGLWYFIGHRWVVSPDRLVNELGFSFQYSSMEVVRQLLADADMLVET